jgi:hypothetical protein
MIQCRRIEQCLFRKFHLPIRKRFG